MPFESTSRNSSSNVLAIAFGLIMVTISLGVAGCGRDRASESSTDSIASVLLQAAQSNQKGEFARSLALTRDIRFSDPNNLEALAIELEAYLGLGQATQAAKLARDLAAIDPSNATPFLIHAFDWDLKGGEDGAAELDLVLAIKVSPDATEPHRLLAQLYSAQGRRFEASEQMLEVLRHATIDRHELLSLIDRSGPFPLVSYDGIVDRSTIKLFDLGDARHEWIAAGATPDVVIPLVEKVRSAFPDNAAAAAFHGRLLAENSQLDELPQWLKSLPENIEGHPEYWNALGIFASLKGMHEESVRCFGEAIELDPTDRSSLRRMIRSLDVLGRETQALPLRERLTNLDQIFRTARDADDEQAAWIGQQMRSSLRMWEAIAWENLAHPSVSQQKSAPEQDTEPFRRNRQAVLAWERGSSLTKIRQKRLQAILGFQLHDFPLPKFDQEVSVENNKGPQPTSTLQLTDIALAIGIECSFENDFPLKGEPVSPPDVNGGGIAVIDFDLDGWSDLYFAQSGGQPNQSNGSHANQLYRHLPASDFAAGTFADVTSASETGDCGFGQGVCSGDLNQDGFADLVVGNFGINVVYLNQGDGTFVDASEGLLDAVAQWTSSVAVADLDGDHLPEIVEVNYIDDPRALEVECQGGDVRCQPQQFLAASDKIYQCQSDGTFRDWPGAKDMTETRGLGFSAVIANFDRQNGNDLFVANDVGRNHFWTSTPASSATGSHFELVETAAIKGLAVGANGDTQGCMGVAAGDFDRNSTLDLHVTNFLRESVNLFLQNRLGYFSDEASKYGLVGPSYDALGFGTQASDLDNDGWLDLMVMNGHVYDERDQGIAFSMAPQLFRGGAEGFAISPASTAGPFFETPRLGRTLATLDWNRDGRIDFVANHLDAPMALLQNESTSGNWIQFELSGTISERDAIGAEIIVSAGDETWTAWQTAGDGYMCSNEPVLHIGLGEKSSISEVTIRWPSGQSSNFKTIAPNHRYRVIEGVDECVLSF